MLIRHDLKLVFLHVPKCAGKALRSVLTETAPPGSLRELWNYSYSNILHRYVDLAHLPLQDLRAFPEFAYLDHYKVLACTRNPYARLPSAVNEFYRQRSKEDEQKANDNQLSEEMKNHYYDQLPARHSETDPRFIHSLPIHFFTHYGDEPKVDFLLRCDSLRTDFLDLADRLHWPAALREQASQRLRNESDSATHASLSPKELALANKLYTIDIQTFGYAWIAPEIAPLETPSPTDQARIQFLHQAPSATWHWGPTAMNTFPSALRPCRP